jgi:hypothetical protein
MHGMTVSNAGPMQAATRRTGEGKVAHNFDQSHDLSLALQKKLKDAWVQFLHQLIGTPTYSFTLTLRPVFARRRASTKTMDAVNAFSWFLNVLNSKCFGHGYRRQGIELGLYASLEGIGSFEQPHWHGVIRLPAQLSKDKFLSSFDHARRKTKRLGNQFDLQPYYEKNWYQYTLKTGVDSVQPEFLRAGSR